MCFTNASADSLSIEGKQSVQTMIDSVRQENKVSGIQFCTIDSYGVTTCWTSGYADNRNEMPITADATMRIGSTTKLFTGYIIMKLIQDSLIHLGDPLSKWYPDFPNADRITIRNLLMHKSGVMEILRFPKFLLSCVFRPHKVWKVDELIAFISENSKKKAKPPDVAYEYSNTNYILLGAIAEKTRKKEFNALVEEIAGDIPLQSTSYIAFSSNTNHLVNGYDRDFIPFFWGYVAKPDNTSWTSVAAASGGIISNAKDLCVFFDWYANGRGLNQEIKMAIFDFEPCRHPDLPSITGIGLGVFRFNIDGVEYWGHEGQMIGSESLVLYCPANKCTYCVVGNRSAFKGKYEIISRANVLLSDNLTDKK
jgi:D-alanyl-D-alanine carboxypeptidase